jgi:endonuclease/exonuclease/phosphatase family metal-dependent hydrolase
LANRLYDVGARLPDRRTFPSRRPFLRLDRVYTSRAVQVTRAHVDRSPLARAASDHLPIIVDVTVEAEAAADEAELPSAQLAIG